jgi:transcription elongation GreA/GreB family factor
VGRISWTSPLGRALVGATINECVTWPRADGTVNITITAIDYPCASLRGKTNDVGLAK